MKASKFHAHSELLSLLNERYKQLGLGDGQPYHKPRLDPQSPALLRAARDYAAAHPSDPFMGKRILHYMRQGYDLVSDVQADATRILQAAEAARRARLADQVPA